MIMRLTKKLEPPYEKVAGEDYVYTSETRLTQSFASVEQKLGQLEDIEEKLDIDLITLFKAFTQGYIYIDLKENNNGITQIIKFEVGGIVFDKKDKVWRLTNDDRYDGAYWGTLATNKNYGKTWALTREELE